MFKRKNSGNAIGQAMFDGLKKKAFKKEANQINKVASAIENIFKAAELFDSAQLYVEADILTSFLEAIASKKTNVLLNMISPIVLKDHGVTEDDFKDSVSDNKEKKENAIAKLVRTFLNLKKEDPKKYHFINEEYMKSIFGDTELVTSYINDYFNPESNYNSIMNSINEVLNKKDQVFEFESLKDSPKKEQKDVFEFNSLLNNKRNQDEEDDKDDLLKFKSLASKNKKKR